jgi:hypothetical protein
MAATAGGWEGSRNPLRTGMATALKITATTSTKDVSLRIGFFTSAPHQIRARA